MRLLAVGLLLAVAACSGAGPETSGGEPSPSPGRSSHVVVTPPAPEPGVHMSFLQQRLDEGSRLASLRVENATRRTLHLRRIGLDWPGWGRFTVPLHQGVGPGETLDLPLRLPRERCTGDPMRSRATGLSVLASGRAIRRPVDDMGMRFAERLWRTGCVARRLRRAVVISYGALGRAANVGGEPVLETHLRVRRRHGSEPVRLLGAQGSVLFDLRSTGRREVAPDDVRARLPLAIDPGRCDQHARSQASQPFTFRLFLRLGEEGDQLATVLVPDREQRRELLAFLDRACS